MDNLLWHGEYYVQRLDDVDAFRYRDGIGCHSDQLLGQFMAHVAGLDYVLPREHVRSAVKAIYDRNFYPAIGELHSVQRTYCLNDESGLVLCSWPHGGRPRFAFAYCDEIWTGVEYQVAAHLIYEGCLDEGLTLVKSVRDRYDGFLRSPWSEIEAGHHYVRAMASWGVLKALSGFECDMVEGVMSFAPRIKQHDFSTLWSNGKAWGTYTQELDADAGERHWEIDVLYGSLDGVKVNEM